MGEIIVVHELGAPVTALDPGGRPRDGERPVRRVHAAPAAPGAPEVPGPRTLCGKDTFAMEAAGWRPSEHPGPEWYDPDYSDRVCAACATAMEA
ncbi:hypothetical protein FCH28_06065 [Streptomyces piniterrae]|uniref:Uncharacterized protein n=1 Tax=Streptomyces piniterrae TaxID=2571125 RepID=A0A4U0NR59_9ACTN|nr:hypothetical protein [Streptomyces piniterrae]TJZ57036.1 hypothetical protein FCH28_06065 [Streptomyces piniterrae]